MVKWLKTHYWRMFIAVLHRCLWLKPNSIPHLLHVQRTFPIAHRCYCCVKVVGKLGKVRQHVNPLSHYFQQPLTIQYGWNEQVYKDSTKPLLIDLGCGKGWFCLHYAEAYPDWNVLGLEIRESLVQRVSTTLSDSFVATTNGIIYLGNDLGFTTTVDQLALYVL